jgi:methyl-accepting chemotaxis protein
MIEHFIKALPLVGLIAAACAFLGWAIRGVANKPVPSKVTKSAPVADSGKQERVKNLEAALEKSRASHKATKAELDHLKAASVSKEIFENVTAELDATRKSLDTETKRISTLETDLKKSQETIKNLNARANDADKAQKDRRFALENELSKAREQLAVYENRPNDSAELTAEIERLRESVAVSTRFAGEMRKREAAAVEALEKAEARLAAAGDTTKSAPVSKKIGPVVQSDRIAAAKAEVIRLVEQNKKREAQALPEFAPVVAAVAPVLAVALEERPAAVEKMPAAVEEKTAAVEKMPAAVEERPAAVEETPVAVEEISVAVEETPAAVEETPAAVEETSVAVEETPVAVEETPVAVEETPAAVEGTSAAIEKASEKSDEVSPSKKATTGELFSLD